MRYYNIARLREGVSLRISPGRVEVNLDRVTPEDHITNDEAFRAAQAPGTYFYLSGGGSLLIGGRFMPVVKRADAALVNPGKYSLFTGRAEGLAEWRNPSSVLRELFEELQLYRNGAPIPLKEMTPLPLSNTKLIVRCEGMENITDGFLHISAEGDMNLLFLFAITLPREELAIRDGEGGRPVFLLDIHTHALETLPGEQLGTCPTERMTPHLAALAEAARLAA